MSLDKKQIRYWISYYCGGTYESQDIVADLIMKRMQKEAINVTHCCKPKGTVKTIDFERTIDLLDAEIDSLKDAYHQETIADRKTVYSSMILESLHAKKKLKE